MALNDSFETPTGGPAVDHTAPGWYMSDAGGREGNGIGWNYDPTAALAAQQATDQAYWLKNKDTTIKAKNGPAAGMDIMPNFTSGATSGGREGNYDITPMTIGTYGRKIDGNNYFYNTDGTYKMTGASDAAIKSGQNMALLGMLGMGAGAFLGGAGGLSGLFGGGGAGAADALAASEMAAYPTAGIVGAIPAAATTGLGGLTAAEIYALTPAQLAEYAPAAAGTAASGLPSLSSAASAAQKALAAYKAVTGATGSGSGTGTGTGTGTGGGGVAYPSFPGVSGSLALGNMGGSNKMGYDNNLDQLALAPDPYLPFSGGSPVYPVSTQQPSMYAASGGHIQHFDGGGTPKPSTDDTDIFKAIANLPTGFEGKMPSLNPAPLRMGQMGSPTPPKILAQLANTLKNRGFTFADGGQPNDHKHPHYDGTPVFRTGGLEGLGGKYVEGKGDGTSDDITAMLANGEYVFSADVVSALGNGSNKAGAEELDRMTKAIRARARSAPPDKLPPDAKSPLEYLKSSKGKKHG